MATSYLDAQTSAHPGQAAHWTQLADLWQKKLWHQMSGKLIALTKEDFFKEGQRLLDLHQSFVSRFADNLKPLVFVHFSIAASNQCADGKAKVAFIEKIAGLEHVEQNAQAKLLVKLEIALMYVKENSVEKAKAVLDEGKKELNQFPGIMESDLYSKFYLAYLSYYKAIGEGSKYFANTMLYLTYTPLDSMSEEEQLQLAKDVGIAALIGDNIYNFGELLQHPIMDVLRTRSVWLGKLLTAFNSGNITAFNAIFNDVTSEPELASQLSGKRAFLNEKVRIMALMDLVLSKSSSERTLSFSSVAQSLETKVDSVEVLVMKAFSLKVVKGKIDQVQQKIRFTWVQPRVLDTNQIARLRDRLQAWGKEISITAADIEARSPELLSLAR